jgi:nucleoside 2-deoxyribosyltransferase
MTKKYQIFISSTYQDLRDERDQVIKAALEMGHIPVGMEMFSAADEEQWAIIMRQIDQSDYYVLVIAHRYGSKAADGISYTEKEYDYAIAKGIPILGFVIDDKAPWPKDRQEDDTKSIKRLTEFKKKIKTRLVQFWKNKEELHGRVSIALTKAITAYPRTGWARADEVSGPEVTRELIRLSSENASFRAEIESLRRLKEGQEDEVRTVIRILYSNTRDLKVRKTGKWENARTYTVSLADMFHYSAPNLINENTNIGVAQNVALRLNGTGYYSDWPIGKNVTSEILADFASLDLLEPSKKKHSVSDTNEYWSLTKLGKQVLKEFRRVRLEEGLVPSVEATENGS